MNNDTIAPDLLHKGSADDVLICAPKVALPLHLDEATLAAAAHNPLSRRFGAGTDGQAAFGVAPELMKRNRLGAAFAEGGEAQNEWERVRALPYQIVAPQGALEGDDAEQAVAQLCEAIPAIRRSSSFRFINNADNYFFYRKSHEHVPGTMFIEAARQAVYHHLYHHTGHARGDVTVSVNELNASFFAYAELMYPIELVVDNMTPTDAESPKKIFFRVSFYQRQTLFATIDTKATVIDMRLFEKTRNIFIHASDWFTPIHQSKLTCTLSDSQGRKADVLLVGLGKDGCVTTTPEVGFIDAVTLHLGYEGKFEFSSAVRSVGEGKYTSWEFPTLGFNDLQVLSDMIKRGFVHLDEAALGALRQ
ncbi:AfsA-related hotdog domain-containing protein [Pseudomonas sp. B11(2017)]|uniref:AfsA-related hotdog domain-containing protein n=1 Tax=Pseudomonas sp. B11(2017) TaxID=1981748 RepID=UPI000A1E5645|nr:AfsA-related hotdog domain-containing protein [Pseudomonas sp. B11(2017)]